VLNPFNADIISNTALRCGLTYINFELEMIELQENIELKQRDFWKLVDTPTYPVLACWAVKSLHFLKSTYIICEHTF
jgi:hypothetical protein